MSGLFKSGGSSTASTVVYTGLQVQTAVSALPIPIVLGRYKIAPNVIWYENFQAIPVGSGSGGKGFGGGGSGSGQYDYTAAVILAICEGPIIGIDEIWRGQSVYTLAELGLSLFLGTTPQTTWSYLTAAYPTQAEAYQGTAFVCSSDYDLSSAATLDNHNFEVQGPFDSSGINGVDADPAQIVNFFLTNAQCGVGFPSASIATSTLFGAGGDASYQTYCAGVGLALSVGLTDQETASSILARWLNLTNTAAVWSGGQLKFIPYGDTATIAGSVNTAGITIDVPAANTFITPQPTIYVAPAAAFVADLGVTYQSTGAPLTKIGSGTPSTGQYLVSPAGTYVFSVGDENVGVNIAYQYTTGANFVPNVTPIYDLGDDDYMVEDGQDPLQVDRSDPYEANNVWRVEIAERANAYNLTPVEARDQNAIELFGMRIAGTVTAHEICDPQVGLISAQLMLQRAVYIRNTYKFRLSWEYCLLDPMDLVTVTDALIGLTKAPVRITDIEEDENGYLEVTAEEFPQGVASATLYATTTPTNNPLNRNVSPGGINTPIFCEPTDEFAGGNIIGIAVSGQNPSLYGGSNVYVSLDGGNSFDFIGVAKPATMGVTTADLPTVSVNATGQTVDTVNTLAVDLTESAGVINQTSDAAALSLATPCILNEEIICYGNAALTAANKYNLTYLVRGAFGSESDIVDHPAGTPFALLNSNIFDYEFAQNLIGSTIMFKFQPFNVWEGGMAQIADCPEYPYVIQGLALASPLPNVTNLRTSFEAGFEKIFWDEIDDFRSGIMYEWRQAGNTNDWDSALPLRSQAHPPFVAQGNGTFLVKARCQPTAGLIVYSETAAAITVAGNQLSINLLASWDEKATGWKGWFDNGIGVDGADLRLGGSGNILGINPLLVSANAAAAVSSGNAIPFTSISTSVAVGMAVADTTTANVITSGATVQSIAENLQDYGSVATAATLFADYGSVATTATVFADYGSVTGTVATVTINPAVTGGGVLSGDTIIFSVADILDFGGIIANEAVYYTIPSNHIINAGSVVNASVNGSTQIVGIPVGQNILSVADFLNDPDVLGSVSTQYVDGWIEIATSQTVLTSTAIAAAGSSVVTFAGGIPAGVTTGMTVADLTAAAAIPVDTTVQSINLVANTVTLSNPINTPGVGSGDQIGFFGAWQKFDPNVYPAQAWYFRLALETVDPASIPYALAFNFQVQLPSRIDHYQNLTVSSGGLTITFAQDGAPSTPAPFNGGPAANGLPYYNVSNSNPFWKVTGLTLSQLTITFYTDGTYTTPTTATGVNVNVEGY